MFKNKLANYETYSKSLGGNYDLDSSFTCYEVFIELSRDKEGNLVKNRDGSDRYLNTKDWKEMTKGFTEEEVEKIKEWIEKR